MPLLPLLLAAISFGPYIDQKIEGWTIRIEKAALKDASWKAARTELSTQLYRISHVVADEPLSKLRKILIWVHINDVATPCMAYHPGAEWPKEHGSNPAMARAVELSNLKNFVSWTYEQPWMVLHEMAHGYHHNFLSDGFDNKDVKSVWDAEMTSKRYEKVLHWDGKETKHYGTNNQMEYFAECTEAYFGQNDFYPFVNAELKTFDPDGFQLMTRIWGPQQKRS